MKLFTLTALWIYWHQTPILCSLVLAEFWYSLWRGSMKEVAVEDEHNGEDRVFKWKAGDWTITGKSPEVNKRSKKTKQKWPLTHSPSPLPSLIHPYPFLSSYPCPSSCRPAPRSQRAHTALVLPGNTRQMGVKKQTNSTTTTENEILFSYRNNFRLSQEALWMIPIMHKLAVKRYKV